MSEVSVLRARIEARRAQAEAALEFAPDRYRLDRETADAWTAVPLGRLAPTFIHALAHDPASVIRDCEADLTTLDEVEADLDLFPEPHSAWLGVILDNLTTRYPATPDTDKDSER